MPRWIRVALKPVLQVKGILEEVVQPIPGLVRADRGTVGQHLLGWSRERIMPRHGQASLHSARDFPFASIQMCAALPDRPPFLPLDLGHERRYVQ